MGARHRDRGGHRGRDFGHPFDERRVHDRVPHHGCLHRRGLRDRASGCLRRHGEQEVVGVTRSRRGPASRGAR
ncbi:hypothetical protein ACFPRL_14935 [Pseudoclavibacter helvolus]